MKKHLLLGIGAIVATGGFAQVEKPFILPDFLASKISADGRIILSQAYEDVAIYDTQTGETMIPLPFSPGRGNCITGDGSIIVGSTEVDSPVILKNGVELNVEKLAMKYSMCDLNGITSDGKRIVGVVTNPENNTETMWVPMYIDLSADGTVGDVNYLPFPKKDWLGLDPQYVWAISVSADGKTIIGQVKDNIGYGVYPILFRQDSDGEWSYTLPTEELINPDKLPVPEFPGEFGLTPPDINDYMTDEQRAAYQAAYDAWVESNYTDPYPLMEDYMSEDAIKRFNEAVDAYNAEALKYNEKLGEYFEGLLEIQMKSVFFSQNGLAMDSEGKKVAMAAEKEVIIYDDGEEFDTAVVNPTFVYDIATGEVKQMKDLENGLFPTPRQVLPDGTIIGVTPMPGFGGGVPPTGYVMMPGSEEYIPFETQLAKYNPESAAWLTENFTKEVNIGIDYDTWEPVMATLLLSGNVVVSDDWTVVAGGELAYLYNNGEGGGDYYVGSKAYSEEEEGEGDEYEDLPMYETYVIFTDKSGVSIVAAESRLVGKRYFDLNGIEVKNPSNGVYIERSLYNDGNVVTSKKVMK